ncbi:MAG TPA: TIGR02996 domain-containing protein [Gemmata sp.]
MRTFLLNDGNGYRFWNVAVKGKAHTVTFGKSGTAGQSKTKPFATPAAARAAADKLIADRLARGYIETTPKVLSPEETAFEDALRANPHDFATWCAYADWLEEKGDPRGTFMQVQLALEDTARPTKERNALKKQERELLLAHAPEWLGPFAEFALNPDLDTVHCTYTRGWLNRIEFDNLTVAQARALGGASAARLLRELEIGAVEMENPIGRKVTHVDWYYLPGPDVPKTVDWTGEPGLHALLRCPHLAGVRSFQLGGTGTPNLTGQNEELESASVSGALAHEFAKAMPNLEELYIEAPDVDADKLFTLRLPELRVLMLYHSTNYPLAKLAANPSLTNLTALLCHPHAMEYDDATTGAYIRLAQLRAVCRSEHLPALTNLRLRLTDFGDAGAAEIVASGILKRLKILDLRGGCITDAGAKTLADSPDLKNLAILNLRANALTKTGKALIKATGVKADTGLQHQMESDEFGEGALPEYLFDGDME